MVVTAVTFISNVSYYRYLAPRAPGHSGYVQHSRLLLVTACYPLAQQQARGQAAHKQAAHKRTLIFTANC